MTDEERAALARAATDALGDAVGPDHLVVVMVGRRDAEGDLIVIGTCREETMASVLGVAYLRAEHTLGAIWPTTGRGGRLH